MHSTNSTRLERFESHRTDTETLLQSFYQLKQTTRDHVELVYGLTMRQQDFPETDSYCRIQQALRFLGANITTKTDPEDLLIAWVDKRNKAAFNFAQESDRELKDQAARSLWTFHELKVITAKWMQGKDEDRLVRLGQCAMQVAAKHAAPRPPDVTGSVPRTLKEAARLGKGQWGSGHADPSFKERVCEPGELPGMHQVAEMQEAGGGDDINAEEEVVRDDLTVRVGDSTTLDLITSVTKAHNAAMKANEDATNAYNAVARRTAELVTNLLQQPDRTGRPVVMPGRYLEPAQHVNYPWRSKTKGRK